MFAKRAEGAIRTLAVLAVGAGLIGCVSLGGSADPDTRWFEEPSIRDPWSHKIRGWQRRETAGTALEDPSGLAAVSGSAFGNSRAVRGSSELREDYAAFRAKRKRGLARDVARWIQGQARRHYVEDGPVDHWATLEETLARGAEDCDGLELLVFNFLRDLGFDDDEVFRAIIYRPSDGQHHMVTLWFEDRRDPWVIDPTGAMTSGMPRMSQVRGWVPLKLFTEESEFTVRSGPAPGGFGMRTAFGYR